MLFSFVFLERLQKVHVMISILHMKVLQHQSIHQDVLPPNNNLVNLIQRSSNLILKLFLGQRVRPCQVNALLKHLYMFTYCPLSKEGPNLLHQGECGEAKSRLIFLRPDLTTPSGLTILAVEAFIGEGLESLLKHECIHLHYGVGRLDLAIVIVPISLFLIPFVVVRLSGGLISL